ncbi:hypothetical protein PR048_020248 [Dryococelus australis]|uniref:Uncharacterized protein n=1 Tax=Dryococelus australis TaxID=614101 RepID=A0ABQ9H5W3_9NEOP|nr:hypothetical protein PR048_020248 [Dryococelus australis]
MRGRKGQHWVRPTKGSANIGGEGKVQWMRLVGRFPTGELRTDGSIKFFFRTTSQHVKYLLHVIGTVIEKKSTPFRDPIPTKERLATRLRVWQCLSTISVIVPEVCDALIDALQRYVRVSKNQHIDAITYGCRKSEKKWRFPICVGSMDGKPVT